jgi:pimeloyl-ACP methyl ester carboxylesterase
VVFRRCTPPYRGLFGRTKPGSVASLEAVEVGGAEQWVLLRGVEETNPVLLYLHDGPGLAQILFARQIQKELERAFVVANWDQRGAGLSYPPGAPPGTLTLNRLVDDTVALSTWLCERFHRPRILLAGHSWGSIVGLLAAQRAPQLYEAYIGVDQSVDAQESGERLARWVVSEAKERGEARALQELTEAADAPESSATASLTIRRWAERFGGVGRRASRRGPIVRALLELEEYTLFDLPRWRRGRRFSMAELGPTAASIDLPTKVSSLQVPTYFLAGRNDKVCDPELAREYLRVLDAPRKGWAWVDDAAHLLPFEQPDAVAAAIAHFAIEARGPAPPAWTIAG